MRFKKLRIFTAIAMIIFILIFGSVIALGFYQGKTLQEEKIKLIQLPVTVIEKEKPIIQNQKVTVDRSDSSNDEENSATISDTPKDPPPKPTIRHMRRRSRAS